MTLPSVCDESVLTALKNYQSEILQHPIKPWCIGARLPEAVLQAFAKAQFVDSTMWVSMLSLIKGNASFPQLRDAVRRNILDEVGDSGIPHVTLCNKFVKSIGVPTS